MNIVRSVIFAFILFTPFTVSIGAEPNLTDMYWRALSLSDQNLALPPEQIPHIAFHQAEGRIAGFGGCNRFFATYELHDSELTIRVMGGGRAQCPDLDGLEHRFLSSLQSTQRYSINNKTLTLENESGVLIKFIGVER